MMLARAIALEQGLARRLGRGRPIPLGVWEARRWLLARLARGPNPGLPPKRSDKRGLEISPDLVRLVAGHPVGGWSLEARSLAWLWACLVRLRPRRLLECGTGISTIVLAGYAAFLTRSGGNPITTLLSLEQDETMCERSRRRLEAAGLAGLATVVHVPVNPDGSYERSALRTAAAAGAPIEFVLIDGPFGPSGCRRTVLPTLLPVCAPGAMWLLDDALRTPDLAIVREWSRLPGITLEGIVPVGQGLAVGRVA